MSKIGFEMEEEERALKVLDTVLDIATAQFVEGFVDSVLTREESKKLTDLLMEANGITSKALDQYETE